jgi:predicted MFS family arabinose efflux permease
MWKQILEGLSWVWRQPVVRMMNLLVAGSNLIFAAVALVLIVLARQQHASPALIGAVFSVGGIGGVLGSLVSPWVQRRFTVAQVVIGVNWVWALFLPLLIVAPNPIVLGAVFAAMVFVGPVWNVVQGSYQTAIVPDELRSRVNSVGRFISWGTIPLGSGISGLLLQTIGARPAVLFLFVAMLTLAVLSTLSSAIREAPSV